MLALGILALGALLAMAATYYHPALSRAKADAASAPPSRPAAIP